MAKSKVKQGETPAKSNRVVLIVAGLVAVGALGFAVKGIVGANSAPTSSTQIVGNVQVVNMKVSASGYDPSYIVVKKGMPVKIITDSTKDAGCVRGFQMPDLGVPNKALNEGKDEIDFVPDKLGQFGFNCQMNMSKGTVNVVA